MGKKKNEIDCWSPEQHPTHMCKLLKKGLMQQRDLQAQNPKFRCAKCGAEADMERAVCQPKPL